MSDTSSAEEVVVELPAVMVKYLDSLRGDQKRLLKDRAKFANADELRKFVAMNVIERMIQGMEMLAATAWDLHQISVANAHGLHRTRRWAAGHLRKLGAEVNDGESFEQASLDDFNDCGQALYALSTYITRTYPNDAELIAKYNEVQKRFSALGESLMGDQSFPDEEQPSAEAPGDESTEAPSDEPTDDLDNEDNGEGT